MNTSPPQCTKFVDEIPDERGIVYVVEVVDCEVRRGEPFLVEANTSECPVCGCELRVINSVTGPGLWDL
jgi:hypothetical protein